MNRDLKKNLFFTLNYFSLFGYPLKKEEIWQWLWGDEGGIFEREEVEKGLAAAREDGWLGEKEGFYFLMGQEEQVSWRERREKSSFKKIKKAQWVARLLALIDGVKMIAVCSNLGYLNADEEADIDFFVVSEAGKIWSVRFWSVFWMKILGQRPSPKKTKNKICLSYFVTDDNLNLEETKIGEPDIHLIYLLAQYLPLYSEDNLWKKFTVANDWIKRYLPNFEYDQRAERFLIRSRGGWWKRLAGRRGRSKKRRVFGKFTTAQDGGGIKKINERWPKEGDYK